MYFTLPLPLDCVVSVQGSIEVPALCLGVPATTFAILPPALKRQVPLRLISVLFNQGVNEVQTLANATGAHTLQDDINSESL